MTNHCDLSLNAPTGCDDDDNADRTTCVTRLAAQLLDDHANANIDGLLVGCRIGNLRQIVEFDILQDALTALVADCDYPALRRIRNIDTFVTRCELLAFDCVSRFLQQLQHAHFLFSDQASA